MKNFKKAKMVGWYNPRQLARTGFEVFVSTIFGRHADQRLIQALTQPGELERGFYYDYSIYPNDELWIDYIADVGDGWHSTYTMAYHLSQPELEVSLEKDKKITEKTNHGEILIFGGDQVYPAANPQDYNQRLEQPYSTAFPKRDAPTASVFAIPGNHDWYDSLVSFSRIFCEGRGFAGWKTKQNRSYFALKLVGGWWLFGTDVQLGSSLDKPQVEYFRTVMEKHVKTDDRIILCNAEPHWINAKLYENNPNYNDRNMGFFEGHILQHKVFVYIAGDRHYYRRHENSDTGKQKITAGGGGAFLHPTHQENVEQIGKKKGHLYNLKKSFPDVPTSRRLCWRNLLFLFYNPWFGVLTAALYLLTARAFLSDIGRFNLNQFHLAARTVIQDALVQPISIYWVIIIVLGFFLFTDTSSRKYRFLMGSIHAFVHLIAVFFVSWAVSYLVSGGKGLDFNSIKQMLLAGLLIFVGGWIVGSIIMGAYLFVSLNAFGHHHNEAFSSLSIADYKNFIRFKVDKNGNLTIFPIGIRKVAKKWKEQNRQKLESRLIPDDPRATKPELIEAPIFIQTDFQRELDTVDASLDEEMITEETEEIRPEEIGQAKVL
jgi:hypothetical protein